VIPKTGYTFGTGQVCQVEIHILYQNTSPKQLSKTFPEKSLVVLGAKVKPGGFGY
jgi:hypothetical protein